MAIFKRERKDTEEVTGPPPRAVLAAAIPLSGPEAARDTAARQTAESWQNEAWRFYDAIGELHTPTLHIANAVSKADLFGAETDPETGLVTGPTEDPRAQAAAALCLGGAARRAQLQYILAVCWQIPGEAYVVIRARATVKGVPQPDEWLVLSGRKVKAQSRAWTYQDPITLEWVTLKGTDRMIRVWSPHPDDQSKADTPIRSAIPVLREIEKASMNLSAVLDSRIATAGIHAIPQELDLPLTGDNATVADEFSDMLVRAASAGISNPGTAAAQVPVVVTMPAEHIEAFVAGRMSPDTAMDQTVIELRQADLARLAGALPMPRSVAEGSQGESNHWSAWQVEEETYKVWIEPLLDRVGDAFTEYWYRPVLAAMGVPNPERFTLAWDTTGIVARPDATEDANWLHDNGLVSDDWRRQQSGVPEDAVPAEEETRLRRLERLVMADPSLVTDPEVGRRLIGFELEPPAAPEPATPESEPNPDDEGNARALPSQRAEPESDDTPPGLVAAAELLVFDALSRAGGRLLTREHRGRFGNTPKYELHTVIVSDKPAGALLADSFQFADNVAAAWSLDPVRFRTTVTAYAENRIHNRAPHDRDLFAAALGMLR